MNSHINVITKSENSQFSSLSKHTKVIYRVFTEHMYIHTEDLGQCPKSFSCSSQISQYMNILIGEKHICMYLIYPGINLEVVFLFLTAA